MCVIRLTTYNDDADCVSDLELYLAWAYQDAYRSMLVMRATTKQADIRGQ